MYNEVPEIREYLIDGLKHSVEEQVKMFDNDNDRVIFSIVMGLSNKDVV